MLIKEDRQFQFRVPSLQALLESSGPFPPGSSLLGLCDDNLPFRLDLQHDSTGALLIAGDPGCGKSRLLRSMLVSAMLLNPPGRAAFSIITPDPDPYLDLAQTANCMDLLLPADEAVAGLILDLDRIATQRGEAGDRWQGPALILAVEDLVSLFQEMEEPVFEGFYRLLVDGPQVGIWVVAIVSSEQIAALDEGLLVAFGTLLLGYVSDGQAVEHLTGEADFPMQELEGGGLFCALTGGTPVYFWVCDPE